jgi:hypothetical protein
MPTRLLEPQLLLSDLLKSPRPFPLLRPFIPPPQLVTPPHPPTLALMPRPLASLTHASRPPRSRRPTHTPPPRNGPTPRTTCPQEAATPRCTRPPSLPTPPLPPRRLSRHLPQCSSTPPTLTPSSLRPLDRLLPATSHSLPHQTSTPPTGNPPSQSGTMSRQNNLDQICATLHPYPPSRASSDYFDRQLIPHLLVVVLVFVLLPLLRITGFGPSTALHFTASRIIVSLTCLTTFLASLPLSRSCLESFKPLVSQGRPCCRRIARDDLDAARDTTTTTITTTITPSVDHRDPNKEHQS